MTDKLLSKRWLGFFVLLIGSLTLGGCFHGKPHHKHGDMMFEYVAWKLDLTEQQQVLLDDIRNEMKEIRKEHKAQRQQDKATIIGLIQADTLDTTAALSMLQQKQAIMNQYAPQVLQKVAALHATLTPEQKQTIIERINEMGQRHHK